MCRILYGRSDWRPHNFGSWILGVFSRFGGYVFQFRQRKNSRRSVENTPAVRCGIFPDRTVHGGRFAQNIRFGHCRCRNGYSGTRRCRSRKTRRSCLHIRIFRMVFRFRTLRIPWDQIRNTRYDCGYGPEYGCRSGLRISVRELMPSYASFINKSAEMAEPCSI